MGIFVFLAFAWLVFASSLCVHAQSIRILDIDTTAFPIIKAKFYALDNQGKQIYGLTPQQIQLTENALPRTVTRISCPPAKPPVPISVVLTIDISGSMSGEGVTLAELAAKSFVQALPLPSECAISTFDDKNYLLTDFTTSKNKLLKAVSSIQANGGTDYDQGLLVPPMGAIEIAKTGRNKRIIVFLTDGLGSANEAAITFAAMQHNVTIYCVTVGMPAPPVLKRIAARTGGDCFEDINTPQQAAEVYRLILQRAQGLPPCELEWKSASSCDHVQHVSIKSTNPELAASVAAVDYTLPSKGLYALEVKPATLTFRSVDPGSTKDLFVTVTARNAKFTVKEITVSEPTLFGVSPNSFVLNAGASQVLRVTFAAKDSGFVFGQFTAQTDICGNTSFYAVGNFPGKEAIRPTLKILSPNGGETLLAGSDTVITWTGVLPQEKVTLEYSVNGGKTWNRTGKPESNFSGKWAVPKVTSDQVLVKVAQLPRWQKPRTFAGHEGSVPIVLWRPRGGQIVTASYDKTLRVWDTASAEPIMTLSGHTDKIVSAVWSPDAEKLLTASPDGTARIWDMDGGVNLFTLTHNQPLMGAAWNNDGTRVVTAGRDGIITVWNATTGTLELTINAHKQAVTAAAWSPDGKRIMTASADRTAVVWDAVTGKRIYTFAEHNGAINDASWSPNGTEIITLSSDSTACIWDATRGKLQRKLISHKGAVRSAVWLYNGSQIATAGDDGVVGIWLTAARDQWWQDMVYRNGDREPVRRAIAKGGFLLDSTMVDSLAGHASSITSLVWDSKRRRLFTTSSDQTSCMWKFGTQTVKGQVMEQFELTSMFGAHSGTVQSLAVSNDGNFIATSSTDSTAMLWKTYSVPRQMDISDHVFSIIKPKAEAIDIVFNNTQVGAQKDSLFTSFLRNTSNYPVSIQGIQFSNPNEFALVSTPPPFTIKPKSSKSLEFRFKPSAQGTRRTGLLIFTGADTLRQTIRGRGMIPALMLASTLVDFGKVSVGATKDTIITALLRNTTSAPLRIRAVRRLGADTARFALPRNADGFTLAAGGWLNLTLRFSPRERGRTASSLAFDYAGSGSPALLRVVGTGFAATIVLQGRVVDSTGKPLVAKLRWEDLQENDLIGEVTTNSDGTYRLELPAGKRYGYYFEKARYYPVSRNRELISPTDSTIQEPDVVMAQFETVLTDGGTAPINNIFFGFGSANLKESSFLELNRLATMLKRVPDQKLEIAGHTDNIGVAANNLQLSQHRAEAVVRYLVKNGCEAKNMKARGYGSTVPIADNTSEVGRTKNRRVEVRFSK